MQRIITSPKSGFSLLELLLAIFVIAIALGGVMLLFAMAQTHEKEGQLVQEIGEIVKSVKSQAAGISTYEGITAETLYNGSSMPKEYFLDGKTLIDPWGASIDIFTANTMAINFNYLPNSACVFLLSTDWGEGLVSRQVDGLGTLTSKGPDDPVTAQEECSWTANYVELVFQ